MTKPTNMTNTVPAASSATSDPTKVSKPQATPSSSPTAVATSNVAQKTISTSAATISTSSARNAKNESSDAFPSALRNPFKPLVANTMRERSHSVSHAPKAVEPKHESGLWPYPELKDAQKSSQKAPGSLEQSKVSKPQESSASSSPTASVATRVSQLTTSSNNNNPAFPPALRNPYKPLIANTMRERANTLRAPVKSTTPNNAAQQSGAPTNSSVQGRLTKISKEKHESKLWQTYLELPQAPQKKLKRANSIHILPSSAHNSRDTSAKELNVQKVKGVAARNLRPGSVMTSSANIRKQEVKTNETMATSNNRPQLRRSHSSRNFFPKADQDVKVVQNPLFGKGIGKPSVKINELRTCFALPLMSPKVKRTSSAKLTDGKVFDVIDAEKLLTQSLKQCPDQLDEIVKIIENFEKLGAEHKDILLKLFMLSILNPDNVTFLQPFFKAYFMKTGEKSTEFAKAAIPKLLELVNEKAKSKDEKAKSKEKEALVLSALSAYTLADLKDPETLPATLFRGPELSSALCKEYGIHLFKKQLDGLNQAIIKEIKRSNLNSLNLDKNLTEAERNKNAPNFIKFATDILKTIYAMEFPAVFSGLLENRREHIIQYLLQNADKGMDECFKESRTYLSELLFLRIMNPYIQQLLNSPELKNINSTDLRRTVIQLTKVIQSIANGNVEFNEEHLKSLTPLLTAFRKTHNEVIDKHSYSITKK